MQTVYKFWVIAYDNKINDLYENKFVMSVFAANEDDAKLKVSKLAKRNKYECYEATELVQDSK